MTRALRPVACALPYEGQNKYPVCLFKAGLCFELLSGGLLAENGAEQDVKGTGEFPTWDTAKPSARLRQITNAGGVEKMHWSLQKPKV